MLKAVEKLLNNEATRVGNHSKRGVGDVTEYIYHWTTICAADPIKRTATIDNGGYATSSTSRAINDYMKYFSSIGYDIIDNRR